MAKPPVKSKPKSKSAIFNRPVKDYAPAPLEDKEPEPNFDLLDEATKDELRKKAAAKVEAKEKERAEAAYLEAEMDRIERELHPEAYEEEKDIFIDLAIFADRIILDGRHYMHGRTYKVKKRIYDSMQEIITRTHRHYAETHRDPTRAMYEAQREISKGGPSYATLNANTGAVTKF